MSGSSSGGATPALTIALGAITPTTVNGITFTGSSTPTLAVTGTTSVSGTNTGDQTSVSGNAGTATALQTARSIYGNNFDGTAALAQIIASNFGGTGNGFTKFSGPTTTEKTFTLPDASATLLYSGGALGTPSSGDASNLTGTASGLSIGGTAASVTNATLTTGLTVNTGTVTFTGNAANTSVLTLGAGASSISGTNTGDNATNSQYASDYRAANFVAGTDYLAPTGSAAGLTSFPTLNQNTTGSAATLTTPRNINGVAFDGSGNITVTAAAGTLSGATLNSSVTGSSLTTVGTLTGGATGTGFTLNFGTSTLSGNIGTGNISGIDVSDDINLTAGDGTILTGDDVAVDLKTVGENGVGSTASVSGLEFESGQLTLLQGCADNEILKWDETDDDWNCESDNAGGGLADADYGDITVSVSGTALTIDADAVALGTDTTGDYVSGATSNAGLTMTGTEGGTLGIALTSSGTTGSTSSNSGLEVGSAGLTLLKGCTDNYILKYTDAGGWACSTDATGGGGLSDADYGDITVSGSSTVFTVDADTITASKIADDVIDFADIADSMTLDANMTIAQGSNTWSQTFTGTTTDGYTYTASSLTTGTAQEIVLGSNLTTGGGLVITGASYVHTGAETGNVSTISFTDASTNTSGNSVTTGLSIASTVNTTGAGTKEIEGINIAAPTLTNCASGACTWDGIEINTQSTGASSTITQNGMNIVAAGIASGTLNGINIGSITAGAGSENGLVIGSGWDNDIVFIDTTPTMSIADNGTLVLADGSSTTNDIFQVGTATSRGNALIYGDLILKGGDIARSLTGVIDVFVYDTAGDVDSGEWRNSPEYLQRSWALETKDDGAGDSCSLATDDRCGNSMFPRKAIIVTTASALYIFDGADNSLWMKFTQSGTYALGADTNNNPSGVTAQNGVVIVGTNGSSATGMYAFDFKQDTMYRYNTTNRTQADVNIANRNSTATYSANAETGFAIIDNIVNDVSVNIQTASMENRANTLIMPIDSQAGPLKGITLIAAATDSGVSVINMGARKVISYSDATGNDYNQVHITKRGRMYATNEALGQLEEWKTVDTNITTQVNGTPARVYNQLLAGTTPITLAGAAPVISTSPSALAVIERGSSARESAAAGLVDSGDIVFVGTSQGLAEVHTGSGSAVPAWTKITTKDSATPYMIGSVRSVHLFDDAAGSTSTNSAVGTTGTTRNPLDTAGATSPTFGGNGIRGGSVNFNNNSYLCSDANADGTCDYDADTAVSTTSFTVSTWFKHSITAAADVIFERCYTPATPTAATGCIYAGMNTTGNIVFGIDDDNVFTTVGTVSMDDAITSAGTWNDGQWHHLVVTNTDTDICMYIDGRQAVACDASLAAALTLDGSQVLTVGGRCTGANCTTGDSYWDGELDEFVWSAGTTTTSGLTSIGANKLYLDGRTHLIRPQATVSAATTFSSTTIGDSGESYTPNAFVGLVVELTGGTGSGQTRKIISNTATTFTVYPAWTTTPDTSTDYRVAPSKLYGTTNSVTSIAVDSPTQINKVRSIYVGTSDSADGGGVSVFSNAGAGGLKTDVYNSDSGVENDDFGTAWSGTGSDNIAAIASYTDTIVFGTGTGIRAQRKDLSLKQMQAETLLAFDDIRSSLVASGLFGATQDVLGLGQGADLAEYYYSNTPLEAGDVVAIQPNQPAGIDRSTARYQKNLLGIVSTKPGLILGPIAENAYPIALGGRIPVKITDENGPVHVGDKLTSSSRPGYAMKATSAGPVLGKVINEPEEMTSCTTSLPDIITAVGIGPGVIAPSETATDTESVTPSTNSESYSGPSGEKCGYAMLFVELGDSLGSDVETLAHEFSQANGLIATTTQESIMTFLRSVKESTSSESLSSIFTERIAAGVELLTPSVITDTVTTTTITLRNTGGAMFEMSAESMSSLATAISNSETRSTEMDEQLSSQIATLETKMNNGLFVVDGGVTIDNLTVTGDATFAGESRFNGLSFFDSGVTFAQNVTFTGATEFTVPPLFNTDTAGFAVIKEGVRKVEVVFDAQYIATPVVNVSISFEDDEIDETAADELFTAGIQSIVMNKSASGFTILLNKNAPRDIRFSWSVLSVKNVKIFESLVPGLIIETDDPVVDNPSDDTVGDIPTDDPVVDTPTDDITGDTPTGDPVIDTPTDDPVVEIPTDDSGDSGSIDTGTDSLTGDSGSIDSTTGDTGTI